MRGRARRGPPFPAPQPPRDSGHGRPEFDPAPGDHARRRRDGRSRTGPRRPRRPARDGSRHAARRRPRLDPPGERRRPGRAGDRDVRVGCRLGGRDRPGPNARSIRCLVRGPRRAVSADDCGGPGGRRDGASRRAELRSGSRSPANPTRWWRRSGRRRRRLPPRRSPAAPAGTEPARERARECAVAAASGGDDEPRRPAATARRRRRRTAGTARRRRAGAATTRAPTLRRVADERCAVATRAREGAAAAAGDAAGEAARLRRPPQQRRSRGRDGRPALGPGGEGSGPARVPRRARHRHGLATTSRPPRATG